MAGPTKIPEGTPPGSPPPAPAHLADEKVKRTRVRRIKVPQTYSIRAISGDTREVVGTADGLGEADALSKWANEQEGQASESGYEVVEVTAAVVLKLGTKIVVSPA